MSSSVKPLDLSYQEDRIDLINQITETINKEANFRSALNSILNEILAFHNLTIGGIYLKNEKSNLLELFIHKNLKSEFLVRYSIIKPFEGCIGAAVVNGKIYNAVKRKRDCSICERSNKSMNMVCFAAIPLKVKKNIYGVLALFAPAMRKPIKDEIELMPIYSTLTTAYIAIVNRAPVLQKQLSITQNKLESLLRNTSMILELSEKFSPTLKINEILERLCRTAGNIVGVSRTFIYLHHKERNEAVPILRDKVFFEEHKTIKLKDFGFLESIYKEGKTLWTDNFMLLPPETRKIFEKEKIKSMLFVPINLRDGVFGVLCLDEPDKKHQFLDEEIKLVENIVRHAATSIESSEVLTREKAISRALQRTFVPRKIPKVAGYDIGATYRSSTLAGEFVGGDFYDFIYLPKKRFSFFIGDVSGKGVETTSIAALVKDTIQVITTQVISAADVLMETNKFLLKKLEPPQFITVAFCILELDKHVVNYVIAGHTPPIIAREGSDPEILENGSLPIGIDAAPKYGNQFIELKKDDCLLLYTDGITEAKYRGSFFGEERLAVIFKNNRHRAAQDLADIIRDEVLEFTAGNPGDDMAILSIKRI